MALQAPGLESGLNIIKLVSESREIGFNQLKSKLELSPASLNRYLKILLEQGFIEKNENQQYIPGVQLITMCTPVDSPDYFKDIMDPSLEKLSSLLGYSSVWIHFENGKMVCRSKFVIPEGVAMQSTGSVRTDYLIHPWGYLLLASMKEEKRRFYIENSTISPTFSSYIPEKNLLDDFIQEAYQSKFSDDKGKIFPNIRRIAVPLYLNGRLEAAIGMGMPGSSFTDEHISKVIHTLEEKVIQITRMIKI